MTAEELTKLRVDHKIILGIVESDSRVLDLGCGDGELLLQLKEVKNAKVQGIELDEASIHRCVEKGLNVYHSDIDSGLTGYPPKAFDYVILNQTLQEIKKLDLIINESLRVGKKVIVGLPNFAHLRARMIIFFEGKVPVTKSLPYTWYDTPNLRFLSIKDFKEYCREKGITIESSYFISGQRTVKILPNLFARDAIFVLKKNHEN
jgi:methionine biosynthesis protein MetW